MFWSMGCFKKHTVMQAVFPGLGFLNNKVAACEMQSIKLFILFFLGVVAFMI
jgi:hypothetical protein